MKYTLLELTQEVLSSIDGDDVSTINGSPESTQVAKIIRQTYYDLINRADPPELYTLFSLTESGSSSEPVFMTVPLDIASVRWVKYDNATATDTDPQYIPVSYLPLEEFLERMHGLRDSASNVNSVSKTIGSSTVKFLWLNDKHPQFYTTFDDRTLVFDSHLASLDSYLKSSKTVCYGRKIITFIMSDTFTPDLDEPQFALLLNEAKASAWAELRQTANLRAEQLARRGWAQLYPSKHANQHTTVFDRRPNYGRK